MLRVLIGVYQGFSIHVEIYLQHLLDHEEHAYYVDNSFIAIEKAVFDKMPSIILDTSSILFSMAKRKDILAMIHEKLPSYEILISKGVIKELERLASTSKRNSRDARAALQLLQSAEVGISSDNGYVDKWIIREAAAKGLPVCTNDSLLRKALVSKGISVITVGKDGRLR